MKKFFALMLAAVMALSLVACGSSNDAKDDQSGDQPAEITSALGILETAWNDYGDDEKFSVVGGETGENMVEDAPADYDLSDRATAEANLALPETAQAMDVPLTGDFQENAVDTPFFGSYTGKTEEPLTADTLRYLTGETLDACTVYDYETEAQESLYDLSAVDTKTPYDLYLQGSKSLLHIDSPLSATDKTLVVFRDSFGSSLIPLLAESYRTIYAVDIRYLPSQLLGRYLTFDGSEDVLFLYSVMVLQNSLTMK